MGGVGRPWTPEEEEALRMHYPLHGSMWDGWGDWLHGRTQAAISERAHRLGLRLTPEAKSRITSEHSIKRRDRWTPEEVAALEAHYREHGPSWGGWRELLNNRKPASIAAKAKQLGVNNNNSRRVKHEFTKHESEYILKVVIKLSDMYHASPYDIAMEMIRLGKEYERQAVYVNEQDEHLGEPS